MVLNFFPAPGVYQVMSCYVQPRKRGEAGAAITNTSRQVAVALGVAVLGLNPAQARGPGLGTGFAAPRPAAG
jgi:hypothetical protein